MTQRPDDSGAATAGQKRRLISRSALIVIAAAALALGVPIAALYPYPQTPTPRPAMVTQPLNLSQPPPLTRVYTRRLFADGQGGATPSDAPVLTGIAGRLNRDAVAMVRLRDGSARTMAVGELVEGWRLETLSIDAALFTRGRVQVRVAMETAAVSQVPGQPASDTVDGDQ